MPIVLAIMAVVAVPAIAMILLAASGIVSGELTAGETVVFGALIAIVVGAVAIYIARRH